MKILVHCSILFFLDFWHEWVLNFILAEKENQKVLFNRSQMSLFCANQPSVDLAKSLELIFSHSILDAKIKILRPPVGTGFKLPL